jgi:hypothetical protein
LLNYDKKVLRTEAEIFLHRHEKHSLSQEFREIQAICDAGDLNLETIMRHMHGRGPALFTLVLSGPFLLPIPSLGLSIPFGFLIALFGLSLATGLEPWLPKKLLNFPLPAHLLHKICHSAIYFFKKLERFIKPRFAWIHRSRIFAMAAGGMISFLGLMLAMPLPPGTNAPPSLAIVCLSIALLEEDGLLMAIGYTLFAFNLLMFSLIAWFGYESVLLVVKSLLS